MKTIPVTQRVHPVHASMADRLNVSVALAVPDHFDMLCISYRSSAQIATLRLNVGPLLPMGPTAIGKAWLSGLPPHQRENYLSAILDAAGREAGTQAPNQRCF